LALSIKVLEVLRCMFAKLLELSLSRPSASEKAKFISNPLIGLRGTPSRGQFGDAVRVREAREVEFGIARSKGSCRRFGVSRAVDADLAKERMQGGLGPPLVCQDKALCGLHVLAGRRVTARVEVGLKEQSLKFERSRGDELLENPMLFSSERVASQGLDEAGKGKKSMVEGVGFLLEMCCHEVWLVGWVRMTWSFFFTLQSSSLFCLSYLVIKEPHPALPLDGEAKAIARFSCQYRAGHGQRRTTCWAVVAGENLASLHNMVQPDGLTLSASRTRSCPKQKPTPGGSNGGT